MNIWVKINGDFYNYKPGINVMHSCAAIAHAVITRMDYVTVVVGRTDHKIPIVRFGLRSTGEPQVICKISNPSPELLKQVDKDKDNWVKVDLRDVKLEFEI
jgi:hypothetical protein